MQEEFEKYARQWGFSLELVFPDEPTNYKDSHTNFIHAAWCEAWQLATSKAKADQEKFRP